MNESTDIQGDATTGSQSPIIKLNGTTGDVTINQSTVHHHYHQINEPIITAMLETIARLEAKVDELTLILHSGRKKIKNRPQPCQP